MTNFKQELFNQFALIGQALSAGPRLEMLEYLGQKPRSVDELAKASGYTVANTSRHLQVLKAAGLVTVEQQGKTRCYSVASEEAYALFNNMRKVAEQHLASVPALINDYLACKDAEQPMSAEEFSARYARDELILLDIRPEREFAAAHIPGAINVPPEQMASLADLPMDKEYVAYCRGPYCVFSYAAVELMRQHGATVTRLDGGLPEWQLAGREVV